MEHQNRIWKDTCEVPEFKALNGDAKTDTLIIGGGAAGILCAYFLQQAGVDYILVEGDRILSGVTGGTTAKITFQHGLIYSRLIKTMGYEKADLYLKAGQEALQKYRELSDKFPCDFEEKNSFVYSTSNRIILEREVEAARRLLYPAIITNTDELPFKTVGAVKFSNQAQFDPIKFFSSLSKGLNIYEKTFVRELKPYKAVTGSGTVTAKNIIVTSHFPFLNKHGSFFLKMYQSRSYVIALENAQNVNGMYVDASDSGLSFRNYKNMLLIGGGGHRTGEKSEGWSALRKFAEKYYPSSTEKYHWAAQDCMTLDGVPYIGKYSALTEGLYVATGFNKWGMTSSMAAAMLLTDLIIGNKNKYEKLFSPSRNMLRPQLFINIAQSASNLLSFGKKRCPHLGCVLKWNSAEQSWDCPCHGSRFSEDGKLLDNPANGDLK